MLVEPGSTPFAPLSDEELAQLETSLSAHVPTLSSLFETSPDCLKLIDTEGRLVAMNANGCTLMEIEDFDPLKGQAWAGFWPDPEPVKQALKQAEQSGFAQFQAFCPTAKGTPKWWDVQITRMLGPEKDKMSFLSGSRDITYLKEVEATLQAKNAELQAANAKLKGNIVLREQELQSSNKALVEEIKGRRVAEEQFQAAFEHAPVGAAIISLDGEYLNLNEAACEILGYPCEAMIGKRVTEFIHPDEAGQRKKDLKRLLTGDLTRLETLSRYFHRDGHIIWVNAAASLVRGKDGAGKYFIAHIVDVTKHKRTESALAAGKARLETVLHTMSEGLVVQNAQGEIIESNASAERILGLSREQLEGKRSTDPSWQAIHEDGSPFPGEAHYATLTLKTGEPHRGVMGVHKPSGELTWIYVDATATFSADGEVETVITVFTDVSDLRAKTEALETYTKRLERSNRDLQDFAFAASHDLQEPLRMVSSYVQLLKKRYAEQLDDDANEFIDFAVDGATRMKALITDLLAYSRIDTRTVSDQRVDLNEAFETAKANLASALHDTGATLHCDTLPTVRGDAGQFAVVFQNLLGNALKYRSDKTPEIHVSASAARQDDQDVWHIAVRDNGIGLAAKNAEVIFTLFTRLHTRDAYAGNGIGLTLCRRILERHGGKIWVDSTPGQGATFYFTVAR